MLDLVRNADALVENYRLGQFAEVGLGEDILRPKSPDLVIARISDYGWGGSDCDKAAFGVISEAVGGLRHLSNFNSRSCTVGRWRQ